MYASTPVSTPRGEAEVMTIKGLYHLLGDLMTNGDDVADRPVFLGHDPEGNPPIHALAEDGEAVPIATAEVFGQTSLILWAGYPQAWDDDVDYGDDDEDEEE